MYDFGGVEEEQDEEDEIKEEVAIEEMKEKPDLKRNMSVKAVEAVDEKRKAEGKEEADVSPCALLHLSVVSGAILT